MVFFSKNHCLREFGEFHIFHFEHLQVAFSNTPDIVIWTWIQKSIHLKMLTAFGALPWIRHVQQVACCLHSQTAWPRMRRWCQEGKIGWRNAKMFVNLKMIWRVEIWTLNLAKNDQSFLLGNPWISHVMSLCSPDLSMYIASAKFSLAISKNLWWYGAFSWNSNASCSIHRLPWWVTIWGFHSLLCFTSTILSQFNTCVFWQWKRC